MIDKGACDKGFIWNPSNCECKCDKSCDVGEYLDYKNCKCKKKKVSKLVEECTETVEEVKLAKIALAEHESRRRCSSCTLYIVLFSIILTIGIGIGSYFLHFHWYLKKMLLVLRLVPVLKQKFDYWSYKMAADVKGINIKNWTYYFFDDMINLNNFDSSLRKLDKMSCIDIGIY